MTNFHGSDLEKIEAAYGIKKETIINYSSNVNPLGLSSYITTYLPQKIELIASYPDRDYTSLRASIGLYANANPEHIMVGNGSTELISLCIKAVSPKNSVIIGPTYSEYEREIKLTGGSISYYVLNEATRFKIDIESLKSYLSKDVDLLVICNPNNPTSTAITTKEMEQILKYCKEKKIFVLVDETYVEFSDSIEDVSSVSLTSHYDNIMVIRGVSKFFAAPGLRLGYSVSSNSELHSKINSVKNPWTINALAAYAGELMLQDTDYINKTRNHIAAERKKITALLNEWDFVDFVEPDANFVLVKSLLPEITSSVLFYKLLKKKLMIRDASTFPFLDSYYFRFCFLSSEDNDFLMKEIYTIMTENRN